MTTDDIMRPRKVLWGSTVGCSAWLLVITHICVTSDLDVLASDILILQRRVETRRDGSESCWYRICRRMKWRRATALACVAWAARHAERWACHCACPDQSATTNYFRHCPTTQCRSLTSRLLSANHYKYQSPATRPTRWCTHRRPSRILVQFIIITSIANQQTVTTFVTGLLRSIQDANSNPVNW